MNNLSAQIIDDFQRKTLVSASSNEADIRGKKIKKMEKSTLTGEILAKRAKEKNISKVFFDRGLLDVTSYLEFIGKRNLNLERKITNLMYDIIFLVKPTKKNYKKD